MVEWAIAATGFLAPVVGAGWLGWTRGGHHGLAAELPAFILFLAGLVGLLIAMPVAMMRALTAWLRSLGRPEDGDRAP